MAIHSAHRTTFSISTAERPAALGPWLPATLGAAAIASVATFYAIGWFAIAGAVEGTAADQLWYAAITSLVLWAMCFAGSLASEIRLAAKRDVHALWSAPVVLVASAPLVVGAWVLTVG